MKLPDEVWQTIVEYVLKWRQVRPTDDVREYVDANFEIELFDGGAFLSSGNEIDLFVIPAMRGKWRIRSTVSQFLSRMLNQHSTIVARVYDGNDTCLRLARHFGFIETGRRGNMITLEKSNG